MTTVALTSTLRLRLAGFAQLLRAEGFSVTPANLDLAHQILCTEAIEESATLNRSMRAVFCQSKQQWDPVSYTHLTLPTTPYV